MRILLAEDEKYLSNALCEILSKRHYDVDAVYDGISALEYIRTGVYDLIILDVMMPKLDGFAVLKSLRQEKKEVPVLMLTAKDEIQDKVTGLDCGADDYMTKPFATEELLARIRALTRRKGEVIDEVLDFADLSLNLKNLTLSTHSEQIVLSLKEFKIMEMLMKNPNQILPKERILEKIWGGDSDAEYNDLEVFISFLRKRIKFVCSNVEIKTSRGIGYSLICK